MEKLEILKEIFKNHLDSNYPNGWEIEVSIDDCLDAKELLPLLKAKNYENFKNNFYNKIKKFYCKENKEYTSNIVHELLEVAKKYKYDISFNYVIKNFNDLIEHFCDFSLSSDDVDYMINNSFKNIDLEDIFNGKPNEENIISLSQEWTGDAFDTELLMLIVNKTKPERFTEQMKLVFKHLGELL